MNDNKLLISHSERDQSLHELQNAFVTGRINEAELEKRTSKILEARTHNDLQNILIDIVPPQPIISLSLSKTSNFAIFSGVERKGPILLPQNFKVTAVFGGYHLDLSEAKFCAPVSTINLVAILGGIEVIVPESVNVYLHPSPILGGISSKLIHESSSMPKFTLHIRALAIFGGIEVSSAKGKT